MFSVPPLATISGPAFRPSSRRSNEEFPLIVASLDPEKSAATVSCAVEATTVLMVDTGALVVALPSVDSEDVQAQRTVESDAGRTEHNDAP